MDISKLSDDELQRLANGENPSDESLNQSFSMMSDDELQKIASGEVDEPGFLKSLGTSVLEGVVKAGEFVDSYTGAPTRSSIMAIQSGKNPITAFASQFGEDPAEAPSGKDIAVKAGVKDELVKEKDDISYFSGRNIGGREYSPAEIVGFLVEMGADPLNFVGAGALTKGAKQTAKGIKAGIDVTTDIASKGLRKIPGVATTSDILKDSAKNTSDALKKMFKPSQADDFKDLVKIADKYGIDKDLLPESIEFGESSFISRAARNRAEGVLGEPYLKKFNDGLDAVRDATEKQVYKISGGSIPSRVEAGTLIADGYNKAVDNLFSQIDFTYGNIIKQVPGIKLTNESMQKINSKLAGLEKFAKGRVKRGITNTDRAQGKQILNAIRSVKNGNGSFKQVYEAMSDIGRHAFKSQNSLADIPVDVEKFRDLYFSLTDEFINSTGKLLGDDIALELVNNNEIITQFMKDKGSIAKILGNKSLSPEKIFTSLLENGDTKKIEALKNILPHAEFQQLKGAFLASQIRKNADEAFTFKSLHNRLRTKKDVLGVLLEPEEIESLGELIKLGDRFGNPVLSTSGTGASNLFGDLTQSIRRGVESDVVIGRLKDSARARSLPSPVKKLNSAKKINPNLTNDKLTKLGAAIPATRMSSVVTKENERQKDNERQNVKLKGPAKWATDGLEKILKTTKNTKYESLKNTKNKKVINLLIQASSVTPNSKAFNNILKQLDKELEVQ